MSSQHVSGGKAFESQFCEHLFAKIHLSRNYNSYRSACSGTLSVMLFPAVPFFFTLANKGHILIF